MQSIEQIEHDKYELIMNTIAWKASIYRANPEIFVRDVLGIHLYPFQEVILNQMMKSDQVVFIGARGLSKTFLTALFCCVKCILYPKTKIVCVAKTLKQANLVLKKIQDELVKWSPFLANEIAKINIGQNDASIDFFNQSWIVTTTSTDNARGLRANVLVVDEYVKVDELILTSVLKKFLSDPRHPLYLDRDAYKSEKYQERNKEVYMSSAWYKSSWGYRKFQDALVGFLDDTKNYFVCALPYQVAIKNGILMRSQVLDDMSEESFDEIVWSMEMECKFFSDTDGSLFKFDQFERVRNIKNVLLPLRFYDINNPIPKPNDIRVMSIDIALMQSSKKKKNDATSIFIADLDKIDDTTYSVSVKYGENIEGEITDDLALTIMRYFYQYNVSYIVIDTNGVGLGVYDMLTKDRYDPDMGGMYKALTCINNPDMAVRCHVKDAKQAIFSVKASSSFNNQIYLNLRASIQNGKVQFPVREDREDLDKFIAKLVKGYGKFSDTEKRNARRAFIETTLLQMELIKLKTITNNGLVTVKEVSGARKDRVSSISYLLWMVSQLELGLKPNYEDTQSLINQLKVHRATYHGRRI